MRRARSRLYVFWACVSGFVTVMLWVEQGAFPVGTVLFLLLGFGPIVWWTEKVVMRSGLEETVDGYAYHDSTGAKPVPLEKVDRFEAGRRPWRRGRPAVFLVRESGGTAEVLGLVQGRPTEWDGGETCDIVGLLNDRHRKRIASRGEDVR